MERLYGKAYAKEVFERLHGLDREFNAMVQKIAYDSFWAKPGLNLRDRSLITIAALIAGGKEEQTKIHMRGFLRSGGTYNELRAAIIHLVVYCGFPSAMNAFAALKSIPDPRQRRRS
jgi:alkylhydroperoxidase/carboxymuconolactone decarboxylase family protein YurZ